VSSISCLNFACSVDLSFLGAPMLRMKLLWIGLRLSNLSVARACPSAFFHAATRKCVFQGMYYMCNRPLMIVDKTNISVIASTRARTRRAAPGGPYPSTALPCACFAVPAAQGRAEPRDFSRGKKTPVKAGCTIVNAVSLTSYNWLL